MLACRTCDIISDGVDTFFGELRHRSVRQPVGVVDNKWFLWRLDAELTGVCTRCYGRVRYFGPGGPPWERFRRPKHVPGRRRGLPVDPDREARTGRLQPAT